MAGERRAAGLALALAAQVTGAAGVVRAEPMTESLAVTVVHAAAHCFADRRAASGTFVARRAVEVRPDRDGLVIDAIAIEAGDVVAKDQELARLVSPQTPTPVVLKAPVAGSVVAASAVVGAYAAAGTGDPLFRIADGGAVELKAETLAANLLRLRVGLPAKLHVIGLGDVDGRVASIDEGVDARTQLAGLRISIAADPRLRVGTFARAEIDTGRDCGMSVPTSAVLFTADGAVVALVRSGRVAMRRVATGLVEGGDIEIRDGLVADDLVVARAGPFLREGDHVRPVSGAP